MAQYEAHADNRKHLLKIFSVIALLTLAQIFWAVSVSDGLSVKTNAAFYFTLTLIKAYLLLFEFMHLKTATRFFKLSFLPLVTVVIAWFVISFCYEGNSGLQVREKNAPTPIEKGLKYQPKPQH